MDLNFLSIDPLTKQVSLAAQVQPLKGINILVQLVLCTLLTKTRSDVLDPESGESLGSIVGKYNISDDDLSDLHGDIAMKVSKAAEEILANQIGITIPDEEKLKKLTLLGITPNTVESSLAIKIRIENALGRITDVVL